MSPLLTPPAAITRAAPSAHMARSFLVYVHHLALRHSLKSEGIFVPKVVLGGEGQTMDIVDRLDVFGFDTHLVHLAAIEGHLLITSLHCSNQTLCLKLSHGLAVHTFHCS